MRRLLLPLLVLGSLWFSGASSPVAGAEPALEARVLDFPLWLGPGDSLRVPIQATNRGNTPLSEIRVKVSIHNGVQSRSQLNSAFRGSLGQPQATDTFEIEGTIPAGQTRTLQVEKPLPEISFFRSADDGAYPVRITVSTGRASAPPITTPMMFFSRPADLPLTVALIIPIHTLPVVDPVGLVVPERLEQAFGDGRIDRILSGLERHPDVPVTLAPTPLLLDTLADLADGYTRTSSSGPSVVAGTDPAATAAAATLDRIRAVGARPASRVIASPYSGAFLPRLLKAGLLDRAESQVGKARIRLREVLGTDPLPGWLLPAEGALDEPTLEALQLSGLTHAILAPASLQQDSAKFTRGAPVSIRTRARSPVTALIEDPALGSRLEGAPNGADETDETSPQARQRFLADTATIMLEQPARHRAVVAVAPADWEPDDAELDGILGALARSPWMRAATPDAIMNDNRLPTADRLQLAPTKVVLGKAPESSDEYLSTLRDALRSIEQFSDLDPPPERIAQLETSALIAESADWWTGRRSMERGASYARSVVTRVQAIFERIRAPASQRITLTSLTGVIPIQVRSDADYPVRVVIRLESDKLEFPSGKRFDVILPPRAQTIEVKVIARTTGTFPLRVTLETPNRGLILGSSQLVVRSTAYNVMALAIMGGAGFFLVVWWLGGAMRRRLNRRTRAGADPLLE